jgi:hypothetical protein
LGLASISTSASWAAVEAAEYHHVAELAKAVLMGQEHQQLLVALSPHPARLSQVSPVSSDRLDATVCSSVLAPIPSAVEPPPAG